MAFLHLVLSLFVSATFALPPQPQAPLLSVNHGPNEASARASAPQIFNALHSAMRQWGSSLNHNGMSFFPAVIPQHVDLYHGSHDTKPVTGTEWLAFEIEHAEQFARNRRRPPGGGRRPPPPSSVAEGEALEDSDEDHWGALHHYRTKHELRVLLLDGMSAGKTSKGTLDTQDYILCNGTKEGFLESENGPTGPPGDAQRAVQMCEDFGDLIEGIVRMEAGFELILCNFSTGVDFISATSRPKQDTPEDYNGLREFEYLRALSTRYQGITAGRVVVDYSHMVSAFFHDANLTNPKPADAPLPRLTFTDEKTLKAIKSEVAAALAVKKEPTINWQGVVDLIITRYSDRLHFMADGTTSYNDFKSDIHVLVTLFVDYSLPTPDIEAATKKCSLHYLNNLQLLTESDHLIHAAVSTVTLQICSTLFSARDTILSSNSTASLKEAKNEINELMKYLQWMTWLECGKCKYDEVCFVAIWPFGGVEEHERPGCVKSSEVAERRGYWGGFGGGGPGRRPGPPPEQIEGEEDHNNGSEGEADE